MTRSAEPGDSATTARPWLLGVDSGGTFNDFVLIAPDGSLRTHKVPSTPDDPARAVLTGLAELLDRLAERPERLLIGYGTTVATNALLERKGARAAFLSNRGFEDLPVLARQNRPELYALAVEEPEPLVPAELRLGQSGRLAPDGSELEPLDPNEWPHLARMLERRGAESLAICLLHSYANPAHEQAAAAAIGERLPGLSLSISSDILPEIREYERAATTLVNAYVAPVMSGYLERLDRGVRSTAGPAAELAVMQSNGGIIDASTASRHAVRTALSGPAGGVVGARQAAAAEGFDRLLTLDMGGTSTDVSLVDGAIRVTTEGRVAGLPIGLPMVDLHTVGAGGGSIARVDASGLLHVGPHSAGADPGPACYGNGGPATVTDANLILGRIDPERFLGGRMPLFPDAARAAVAPLAQALELSVEEAARGIVRVADASMEGALRVVSVELGRDPRDFALLSFGGAGGLHACSLADSLGMSTVLIPVNGGVLSAQGIVQAPRSVDRSRALLAPLTADLLPGLRAAFADLEREASAPLGPDPRYQRAADLRFRGQSFELRVPVEPSDLDGPEGLSALRDRFLKVYEQRFGSLPAGSEPETVALRVNASLDRRRAPDAGPTAAHPMAAPAQSAASEPRAERAPGGTAHLEPGPGSIPRSDRRSLSPGDRFAGPLLITEDHSVTLVPEGRGGRVGHTGMLILERLP